MKKNVTPERWESGSSLARLAKYNFPLKIIFDPELGRKRIEKAPGMYEAKCEEIRTKNAEIDERNKVGKANAKKRNQKCILAGCASAVFCVAVAVAVLMLFLKDPFMEKVILYGIGALSGLSVLIVYIIFIGNDGFAPEEYLECPDSVESFYTINELFVKWWKEEFTFLSVKDYSNSSWDDAEICCVVADKDDVIHEQTFKFKLKPEIVIKRNQICIEFDLIENRIIIPYVASEN